MHSGMGDYYTQAFRGRAMLLRLLPCSIPPPISHAADRKAQMPAGGSFVERRQEVCAL